jgi:hypothetical protein
MAPPACTYAGKGLVLCENGCYLQAKYNMEHAYAGRGLTMVVGSLGIGMHKPFFEFGGPHYTTVAQFKMCSIPGGRISWDAHAWLEDKDGRVYDIVTQGMTHCALAWGKDTSFKTGNVVEGVDKPTLAHRGLVYMPAPEFTQMIMKQLFAKQWDGEYMLQLGMYDKVVSEQKYGSFKEPMAPADINKLRSAEEVAALEAKESFCAEMFAILKDFNMRAR